jgi:hypothetical protein|tara:strand:- start:924 stop:1466 length:543 start_codon:yes stop_codon:yes gene_type:complete
MDTESLENYLDSFGRTVVADAKAKLYKDKGTTALGQSIRFEVVPTDTGFSTRFYMLDYGTFLDKGVSGNKKKRAFENYKGVTQSSPYSYTTKGPPIDIISKWIKRKGIEPKGLGRGRSKKTGQYLSGFAYLISRKIKRDGIKSLSFFQQPLGEGYKELKDEMLTKLKLDIETYLTTFYRP